MSPEDRITATGTILTAPVDEVCVVRMANGHCVISHPARQRSFDFTALCVGDSVTIEMTPYDMSQGRIISKVNIL